MKTNPFGCAILALGFTLLILDASRAQIVNGSFESGLDGWTVIQAVTVNSGVGTDGTHAANIGAFDAIGSAIYQTVSLSGGTNYVLNFDTAANGVNTPGLVSALQASVQANNQLLASITVTDISPSVVSGNNGFTHRTLAFVTPTNASSITLEFLDQSPNGGQGVDALLDNVTLSIGPPGPQPPTIATQPQSQTVLVGGTATFNVVANGDQPLSYQWQFNSADLTNATSSSLNLTNVQPPQAGNYSVIVSNMNGHVTSSNALLTVSACGGITNGSFESGLDDWITLQSVLVIGPPSQGAVGTDGTHVANIGGFDSTGSAVFQTIGVVPGANYLLAFDTGANGVNTPGLISALQASIQVGNQVLASVTVTDISPAVVSGTNGFTPRSLTFSVPDGVSAVTVRFADVSPNGGRSVDAMLDNVRMTCATDQPPVILTQPQDQNVFAGETAIFGVNVSGTPPLEYQWLLNGSNIDGSTGSSLVIPNAQISQQGNYSVLITNSFGFAQSSNAALIVTQPTCVLAPSNLVSWWPGNGDAQDIVGGQNGTFSGAQFAPGEIGQAFDFTGGTSNVRVPASPILDIGQGIGLTVEAWINPSDPAGGQPIVEWAPNGSYGVHFWINANSPGALYANVASTDGSSHIIQTPGGTIATNRYQHVALTYDKSSGVARLFLNGAIVQQSTLGSFTPGTSADFYLGYRPSGTPFGPISFKGLIDDVSIYARALTASEIQAIYNSRSAGKCIVPISPSIVSQPASQTVTIGANVNFAVGVAGSPPFIYQWTFNGTNIPGATASTLTISNAQRSDTGSYAVLVTNSVGFAASSNTVLTVNFPPATVRVLNVTNVGGSTVIVPVVLAANGNETAVGFSLNFNTSRLTYSGTSAGGGASGATLLVNSSQTDTGRLGIALTMPTGSAFPAGTLELVDISFTAAVQTNDIPTPIAFGDTPILRELSDVKGSPLPINFIGGTVNLKANDFEGDVSPRPNGDKVVSVTDWVLVGRYAARLDYPTNASEFQRADCAPRSTLGDGDITVTDWVQAGRYAAGFDPLTPVGGPDSAGPLVHNQSLGIRAIGPSPRPAATRELYIATATLAPGHVGSIPIYLESFGDENALGFSLYFDPTNFNYAGVSLGSSASGATLNVNTNTVGSGGLACVLALPTGATFPAGLDQVLNVSLQPATNASGFYLVSFADQPVRRETSDVLANTLPTVYGNGTITINPAPPLRIAQSGGNATIAWPSWATGYRVQESAGGLPPATIWLDVSGTPSVTNGEYVITVPLGTGASFYRLSK